MRKQVGLLFMVLVVLLATSSALGTYGTYIEKAFAFISQILTFFILIALYSKYKGNNLFSDKEIKLMAISYPLLVVIVPIYQLIEYSEQTIPSYFIYMQTLEFLFSIVVSYMLVKDD